MSASVQLFSESAGTGSVREGQESVGRVPFLGDSLPELLVRLLGLGFIWLGLLLFGATGVAVALSSFL